ncbi:hypothetical protein LMG30113_05441 [Burkholderia paludis]|nr:hypothetical protein LMG30113_05441 [Burkholderia paludis]
MSRDAPVSVAARMRCLPRDARQRGVKMRGASSNGAQNARLS